MSDNNFDIEAERHGGKYLEMPLAINGDRVLEMTSFIEAAYIQRALQKLEEGEYEGVEQQLRQASKLLRRLVDEIQEVRKRRG